MLNDIDGTRAFTYLCLNADNSGDDGNGAGGGAEV